ncbi:MAG: hypothetical protein R3Y53_11535 [Bacillota bacterium]
MLERIMDGVTRTLRDEFGKEIPIYTETVLQGLRKPCLMVYLESPKVTFVRGNRHAFSGRVCVHFVPKTEEVQKECMAVAQRLFRSLGCIAVDGLALRGKKRKYEVVDGVLRFFVTYECQFFEDISEKEDGTKPMESLAIVWN